MKGIRLGSTKNFKTTQIYLKCLMLLTLYIAIAQGATISCPILTCNSYIADNVCYEHDGEQPTSVISGYSCDTY